MTDPKMEIEVLRVPDGADEVPEKGATESVDGSEM